MEDQERSTSISAISVPRDHTAGYIYFVTCDYPEFPVKIGFAANPKKRLQAIRQGLPYPTVVMAIVPGTRRMERMILRKVRSVRLRGEWFRRTPELHAVIEIVKAGDPLMPYASEEQRKHLDAIRSRRIV